MWSPEFCQTKVSLKVCFKLLNTLGKGVQMHGGGVADAVDVACCILPLLCHGLTCRGVSVSCLTAPMCKRALVNLNHLQTLLLLKKLFQNAIFSLLHSVSPWSCRNIRTLYTRRPFSWRKSKYLHKVCTGWGSVTSAGQTAGNSWKTAQ